MKIAFVNDTFLEGRGADTAIYELAKALGKRHEVFVIAPEADFKEENFKTINIKGKKLFTGNTLYDVLNYVPNILTFRREILRLHKTYNFDVLNVHHSSLSLAFNDLPIVVTWNGSPPSENVIRKKFNKILLKNLQMAKRVGVISSYLRHKLPRVISPKKIRIIYEGIGRDFRPKGKMTDKGYMLYVGRLESHKEVNEVILLSKETDYPVYIAGHGPLDSRLKEYAKKIGANKVKFLGKVSRGDLIKYYQECSFFVSASKWEGFGLIFLEAAACSKPSIGYKRGSVPEVILDNKTGFLANTFLDFKEKTEMLINDKKLRVTMGRAALRYSKEFSWEKSTKEYEKLFLEVKNG